MGALKWYIAGAVIIAILVVSGFRFHLFNTAYFNKSENRVIVQDPFLIANQHKDYPMGVVAYGLFNTLGHFSPNGAPEPSYNFSIYQISTNSIFGCAKISSIEAMGAVPTDSPPYVSENGASLNLDAIMVINGTNGSSYDYSLINGILFNTSSRNFIIGDEVYNIPLSNNNSPILPAIIGNGTFSYYNESPENFNNPMNVAYNNYSYFLNQKYSKYNSTSGKAILNLAFSKYSLPIVFCPVIKVIRSGSYPTVQFGYYLNMGNATYGGFYDNVKFLIPSSNFTLLVTPYKLVRPNYTNFYDAEFVFGGEVSGQKTEFINLNASGMWMFYSSNGTFVPFPSLYSTGLNLNASTTDLEVSQGNNYALVTVGTPDLFYNMTLPSSEYNSTEYANVAAWIENK